MRNIIIAIAVSLLIGVLIGIPIGKCTDESCQNVHHEISGEQTDLPEDKKQEPSQAVMKGSSLTERPDLPHKTLKDIEKEKQLREERIASKLPQDIGPLKDLSAKTDAKSIGEAMKIYKQNDVAKRATIELQARNNPALKQELVKEIDTELHSKDYTTRENAVRSAIRLKAFEDDQKASVRELLHDVSDDVKRQAIAYAGWSKDKGAVNGVLETLSSSENPQIVTAAFHCLSVIGKDSTDRLIPMIEKHIRNDSHQVRQAVLSCVLHTREPIKNKQIAEIVTDLSKTDEYKTKVKDKERYPIRELAAQILKLKPKK